MIRRILILLAVLALCLSGLPASAEEGYEAGELHVYRVSMDENEMVPVRWYKDTPSFPFMGIRAYYRMMFGEELHVTKVNPEKSEPLGSDAEGIKKLQPLIFKGCAVVVTVGLEPTTPSM